VHSKVARASADVTRNKKTAALQQMHTANFFFAGTAAQQAALQSVLKLCTAGMHKPHQ